jgi:excisionase family DNA binding protein
MSATDTRPSAAEQSLPQGFATIVQAAKYLQVGRSTIYAMMGAGTLPAKRLPGIRAVRIPWTALHALVAVGT